MVIYCREFVEFLSDYLDRALSPEQKAAFDAHLAVCPPCVAYLKTYQQTVQLGKNAFKSLDEPVPVEVPEELVRAILSARDKGC